MDQRNANHALLATSKLIQQNTHVNNVHQGLFQAVVQQFVSSALQENMQIVTAQVASNAQLAHIRIMKV